MTAWMLGYLDDAIPIVLRSLPSPQSNPIFNQAVTRLIAKHLRSQLSALNLFLPQHHQLNLRACDRLLLQYSYYGTRLI